MRARIVLIGGAEHARVLIEAIRAGWGEQDVIGFVDSEPCEETIRRLGVPRLGGEEILVEHPGALGVIGFAAPDARERRQETVRRLSPLLSGWATVIHAAAWVSSTARVGEGAVVMAGAVVQNGATIGAHSIVNSGAVVEHDVVLGEHVHVAPGAVLGGGVRVGPLAHIGLGAAVRDHISIGPGATVGMGAVVVRDVAAGVTVMGVPAR
jgi:sugar O-acyltransferase (sialic acid O-acetyltransferase NeuD family)